MSVFDFDTILGLVPASMKRDGSLTAIKSDNNIGLVSKPKQTIKNKNIGNAIDVNKINSGIQTGLGVATGLFDLGLGVHNAAQTEDISPYLETADEYARIGSMDYGSFDDIASGYQRLNTGLHNPTSDDLRGMTDGQKASSVLSSTMSGASAGSVFGPWGAAVGGLIGAGAGIAGVIAGDKKAETDATFIKYNNEIAQAHARNGLNSAAEGLNNYNFRNVVANAAKDGGQIERKQATIDDYVKRVLSRPSMKIEKRNINIVRERGEGGLKIKVKR